MPARCRLNARERRTKRSYGALFMAGVPFMAALFIMMMSSTSDSEDNNGDLSRRRLSSFGPFSTECTPAIKDRGAGYAFLMLIATIYVRGLTGQDDGLLVLWCPHLSAFLSQYTNSTRQVFCGLGIICDEFFVPSLEALTEVLKLSPDVAGEC